MKNYLTTAKSIIWKICMALFVLLSAYVLFHGIFYWNGADGCYQDKAPLSRGVVFILGLSFMGLFWIFVNRIVRLLPDKAIPLISVAAFLLLFVLQIQFLRHQMCQPRSDALKIFDETLSMLKDGHISSRDFNGYFLRYPGRRAFTIFSYAVLKTASAFGLPVSGEGNALFILQIVSVLFVDLSYFFGYMTVSIFSDKKSALVCLLFILSSPLSYVWLPYFSANGLSAAFAMGTLYLLLEITRNDHKSLSILFLCGLMIPSGCYIGSVQVIVCIALMIFLLAAPRRRISIPLLTFGIIVLGIFIAVSDYHVAVSSHADYDKNAVFPAEHGIAAGLNAAADGAFNTQDDAYTMNFFTKAEKKAADRQLIGERIHNLGFTGVAKLYFRKLKLTFSDGTGGYPSELGISRSYDAWYQNVYGNNRFGVQYACQLSYLFLLLLSAIGAGMLLIKKKWYGNPAFCVYLSILGAFLFRMVRETGSLYGTEYTSLFFAGFGFSVAILTETTSLPKRKKETESLLGLGFTAVCLCAAFTSFLTYDYTKYDGERRIRFSVNQYQFAADYYEPCTLDKKLTQTFAADMPFNEVFLLAENKAGSNNDSIYHIRLLDEDGDLVSETDLSGSGVISCEPTKVDLFSARSCGRYSLVIEKVSGSESLSFLYYDTGNYDAYPDGSLTGLSSCKNPDLAFIVLRVLP